MTAGDFLSDSVVTSTSAFKAMFGKGIAVVPELIALLDRTARFHGVCGARALESSSQIIEDFSSITRSEAKEPQVRGAALYLLKAIAADNFYFAGDCDIHGRARDIEKAMVDLAAILRDFDGDSRVELGESIDHVMGKNNVAFSPLTVG